MGQLVCGLLMPDAMLDARLHTHVCMSVCVYRLRIVSVAVSAAVSISVSQ